MDKGVYCLIFRNPACIAGVGALREVAFPAGFHIYVGSALGSGGLKRLDRHMQLAVSRDRRPKWHVDYILTDSRFSLTYAVYGVTMARLECLLVRALGGEGVESFGCGDCACSTHLLYRPFDPRAEIIHAFRNLNLVPVIKTLITHEVEGNI
jgi:Uri superfamily endonuclease